MVHHLDASPNGSPVEGTIISRCAVNQLATQEIDPFKKSLQDHRPVLFDVPCLRLMTCASNPFRSLVGWFLPEKAAEILIIKKHHHKFFVLFKFVLNQPILCPGQACDQENAASNPCRKQAPDAHHPIVHTMR